MDSDVADRIDGLITGEEQSVVLAAQLAEKLGVLRRPSVDAVRRARDKHEMRRAWSAAGIPSATAFLVDGRAGARQALRELRGTAIVKPRNLAASAGVRLVQSVFELDEAFEAARDARLDRYNTTPGPSVLVEEYLEGSEFSVEAAMVGQQFIPLAVAEKTTGPLPFFEEIQHVVSRPRPEHDDLLAVVERAVACLGLQHTMVHAEVRRTAAGPAMIEVGARLGGDLIPYVAEVATGYSLGRLAGRLSTGGVSAPVAENRYAGIRFFYAPHAGIFRDVIVPRGTVSRSWLHRVMISTQPGTRVPSPRAGGTGARVGYVIVTGWSAESVHQRLEQVAAEAQVLVDVDA